MISYLVQQLRESCPYLEDRGWTDTAELMNAAANEIERLMIKTRSLEDKLHERKHSPPASVSHLAHSRHCFGVMRGSGRAPNNTGKPSRRD
jgi:hypothetical protein